MFIKIIINHIIKLMTRRFKIIITVFICVLLYSIYYIVAPFLLNNIIKSKDLTRLVRQKTGQSLELINPKVKMGFLPSIWIKADRVTLYAKKAQQPLNLKNPKLKIKLLPLIINHINVCYFSSENSSINLRFDKKLKFYLGNIPLEGKNYPNFSIKNSKIFFDTYKISIKDEAQNKYLKLSGDYLNIYKFDSKKRIILSTNSKINVENNISQVNADINLKLPFNRAFKANQLKIDGSITNLNLGNLSPYIRKFSKGQILKSSGIINADSKTVKNIIISSFSFKNLRLLNANKPASIYYKGKFNIYSFAKIGNNSIEFKKINLLSKDFNVYISGKIKNINKNTPIFDIKLSILNSKSQFLINLLPAVKIKNSQIDLLKLKMYNIYSTLNSVLTIKGKSDEPFVFGFANANSAFIIKPVKNAPKATIKTSFLGKKIHIDVKVPTSKKEFVLVKGLVNLYGKHYTNLDINSTKNIELKYVEQILVPLHEVINFDIGPVPMMKLQGIGNIKLKATGTKSSPHLWGIMHFYNISVKFNRVNAIIKNGYGYLTFNNQDTHFKTTRAYLNSKPINIDGTCTLLGKLKYNVVTKKQEVNDLLRILKTSPLLADVVKGMDMLESAKGKADLNILIYGKAKSATKIKFNDNIFADGFLNLQDTEFKIKGIKVPIKHSFGTIKLHKQIIDADIHSFMNKSKLYIKCRVGNGHVKMKISAETLHLKDLIEYLSDLNINNKSKLPSISNSIIKFSAVYDGPVIFDVNSLNFEAICHNSMKSFAELTLSHGEVALNHGKLNVKKFSGFIKGNAFYANLKINNLFDKDKKANGKIYAQNFDFSTLKELLALNIIPIKMRKFTSEFKNFSGHQNLNVEIRDNKIYTKIHLKNINFVYSPLNMPIKLFSGYANLDGDKITLYRANAMADTIPVLADGIIKNAFSKPIFDIYLNSKPAQDFIDKYLNRDAVYPLKTKGDIMFSSRVKGTPGNLTMRAETNLSEGSLIQYMGGSLGDGENPIRIYFNLQFRENKVLISAFQYDKLVSSQNNREFISPQLYAKGLINFAGKNVYLHNLKIVTQNPTDAKIFNILFKKSIAKQGNFTSDITLNGSIYDPKLEGVINFTGVGIPILDTTLKDVKFNFKGSKIFIKAYGDILANKVDINAVMQNSTKTPYVLDNIELNCDNMNIDKISGSISNFEDELAKRKIYKDKQLFDISDLYIKKASIDAKNVYIQGIKANNFHSDLKLDDTMLLSLDNIRFNVANGSVKGDFVYSFFNYKTGINMSVVNANANQLAKALFDLPNQIYGNLDGNASLYCNGKSHKSCMNSLSGFGGFSVKRGKMPKLGSLEYLLKASNLVKSGITGLTVNNIISIISPLNTGEFDAIRGDFKISSGIARPIEIYTNGKDLDIFIDGSYNFSTLNADLNVFGRLSKKISTVLGPVGNASLNTLFNLIPGLHLDDPNNTEFINNFNKIPGFELNDKMYRIFNAKIYGDINGESYVQSFKWVE